MDDIFQIIRWTQTDFTFVSPYIYIASSQVISSEDTNNAIDPFAWDISDCQLIQRLDYKLYLNFSCK